MTDLVREWWHCVIAPLLFFVALGAFAGVMSKTASATDVEPVRPKVICVFSADYCAPCHDLLLRMKKHGIATKVTETREQPAVEEFPTVFYEVPDEKGRPTLTHDNGQNIYRGNYRLPETPVTVVYWITKGRK